MRAPGNRGSCLLEQAPVLGFRILGPLEVERDGTVVALSGRRVQATLVLLLLEANRVVPAERLIDALWGERPPATAGTALRNLVAQLRKELGHEVIETRPPGYLLRLPDGAFDLVRFELGLEAARRLPPDQRAEALRAALAEWRGGPPPGRLFLPRGPQEKPPPGAVRARAPGGLV